MQEVVFQRLTPITAEAVAEEFQESPYGRELLASLLRGDITSQDFLYLLRKRVESIFENVAERLEFERQEALRAAFPGADDTEAYDEHEAGVPA